MAVLPKSSGFLHLTRRVVRGNWFMMFACLLIMSGSGATYIFGIYSTVLKSSLQYDQQSLNTLSFFKDMGANLGLISGLINEVAPPFVVLLVGAGMNLSGYLLIYLSVTDRIERPPLWLMSLFICVGANSQTFANTGALVTCVKSFPESRGVVLGLLKCFVGLSGAVFTQLYLAFYGGNPQYLLLLVAWLPAAISILSVGTVRVMDPPRVPRNRPFYHFLYLALALAVYLLVLIVLQSARKFSRVDYAANAVVILVLLFLLLTVVVREEFDAVKEDWKKMNPSEEEGLHSNASRPLEEIFKKKQSLNEEEEAASPSLQENRNMDTSVPPLAEIVNKEQSSHEEEEEEEEEEPSFRQKNRKMGAKMPPLAETVNKEHSPPEDAASLQQQKSNEIHSKVPPLAEILNMKQSPREDESSSLQQQKSNEMRSNAPPPLAEILNKKQRLPKEEASPRQQKRRKICSNVPSALLEIFRPPARGEDYSILQALFSVDMIVLFSATICGVGGTLTAIDNMGQIGQALGYPSKSINTFVSLISIWNATGRAAAGFLSEILLSKYMFPRPLMLTFVLLLSCAGHLLIAFGVSNSLYLASVLIGFCFGAQWPLIFAIISEIFGLKYYSTLYNFGGMASPVGSYVLNVMVTGKLYDREAQRQNRSETGDLICNGVKCFQMSFLIITAATLLGAGVTLILVMRTKKFYKGDIYARYRIGEAKAAAVEDADECTKIL